MTPRYIKILLKLTRAQSAAVADATIAHLCDGISQTRAAEQFSVGQSAVARLVKRINTLDKIIDDAIHEKLKEQQND